MMGQGTLAPVRAFAYSIACSAGLARPFAHSDASVVSSSWFVQRWRADVLAQGGPIRRKTGQQFALIDRERVGHPARRGVLSLEEHYAERMVRTGIERNGDVVGKLIRGHRGVLLDSGMPFFHFI